MNPALLSAVSLVLVAGAPALKDPPAKGPAVIGRWEATAVISNGADIRQHKGLEYEFTADGRWLIYRDGRVLDGKGRSYTADPKANPAVIDLTEGDKPYPGVYAIEKDSLTVCFRTDGSQ